MLVKISFAHTLNLVCENAIKSTDNLIPLLNKVRAVVWIRSVTVNNKLRRLQLNSEIGKNRKVNIEKQFEKRFGNIEKCYLVGCIYNIRS